MLTGKYRTDNWPQDSRFGSNPSSDWAKRHFTDQPTAVVDAILALAAQEHCTAAQVAVVPYYLDDDVADWTTSRFRW